MPLTQPELEELLTKIEAMVASADEVDDDLTIEVQRAYDAVVVFGQEHEYFRTRVARLVQRTQEKLEPKEKS